MTTININVPGVTVVVNGDTIDINPSYQQGMHYPFQYGQQYPGWQGYNANPQQQYHTYPDQSGKQHTPKRSTTAYRTQSNPIVGKGFTDSTFTDESLLSFLRCRRELQIYTHHLNKPKDKTATGFTTKSITPKYIESVPNYLCLTFNQIDADETIDKSTLTVQAFCRDASGLWLSKKEVVELGSNNSTNKSA